jgi:MFS family permease
MFGPLTAALILLLAPQRFDLVFVISFALGVVGLAVLLLFVRNQPTATGDAVPTSPLLTGLLPRHRALRLTLLAGCALSLATISDAFIYLLLQRRGLVAPSAIPFLYVGTSATYLVLAVPMGTLADRLARWKVFALGHVMLAVAYGVLLMPAFGWPALPIVLLLLGAYYASTDGVLSAMTSAVLPRAERGSGLGLLATATSLGKMGASLLFGWLWSSRGETTALLVFAAALPVAILASVMILPRAQQEIIAA